MRLDGEALGLVAAGVALGALGALVLARLMAGLLYGMTAGDPATFAAVPLLLGLVAVGAAWGPMRRAVRGDPLAALRSDA